MSWFKISFVISVFISIFFISLQILEIKTRNEDIERIRKSNLPRSVKNLDIEKEKEKFFKNLKNQHPETKLKKYYYLNVWDTGSWDSMDQLIKLDTVIEPTDNRISYICISGEKPDYAMRVLQQRKVKTKNFIYVNQVDSFINAIYKETKIRLRAGGYGGMAPMNVIMESNGKIIYFDTLRAITGKRCDTTYDRKFVITLKNALQNLK